MPDLAFAIEGGAPMPFGASPLMGFQLRMSNDSAGERIHTVALRCQIQIEASRRRYTPDEQARLLDLFGEPDRWSQTLKSLLWTHVSLVVSGFVDSTVVDLPVPCTFDFTVAAAKYFGAVAEGELPLCFQFSGTVFYEDELGRLQVAPISWERETRHRLPVAAWRQLMSLYHPNTAWLCLRRDVFDRLAHYKSARGVPTWEQVADDLLKAAEEPVRS